MKPVRGLRLTGDWTNAERLALANVLEPLPQKWVEGNPLLVGIRREKALKNAPPDAPGHSKYERPSRSIVVFDKGVYHGDGIDKTQFRRSIYHELAHTLLDADPSLLQNWQQACSRDRFVDEYAKTSPEEDFADTFSELFINPSATRSAVPRKARFIESLLNDTEEKTAMYFTAAFADEMVKTAKSPASALKKLLKGSRKAPPASQRTPGKMGVGKAMAMAGLAGGGAYYGGKAKGVSSGRAEGTQHMEAGMQKAYKIGLQRGASAMQQAIIQRLRSVSGNQ